MKFDVRAETDVGLKRGINQDAILVDQDLNLFIVADGMGGHNGGEVASAMAVETVRDWLERRKKEAKVVPRKALQEAYNEANARIYIKSTVDSPELRGMGTTMVLAWEYRERLYFANVGDSRAYLKLGPNVWQITEDHSLVNDQVRAGVISEDDAPHMEGRNYITRSVGYDKVVEVDVLEREPHPDEVYLLCSDGLTTMLSNEVLKEIINNTPFDQLVSRLIAEAKKEGGSDNISVIAIRRQG